MSIMALPLGTKRIGKGKGAVALTPEQERARRSVSEFRKLMPTLTAYARNLTGRKDLQVKMTSTGAYTDNKAIFIRPPLALGELESVRHDKQACNKRNPENLQLLCAACELREEILASVYHEISHVAFDTFLKVGSDDIEAALRMIKDSAPEWYYEQVRERMADVRYRGEINDFLKLASVVNPYLKALVNGLEDTRINERMAQARPGTRIMQTAKLYKVAMNGVEHDHKRIMWSEYDPNMQAAIALFCLSSGFDIKGWFVEKVEKALSDPKITDLCKDVAGLPTAKAVFGRSFDIFLCMREFGFFVTADEELPAPPAPEPEAEPEPQPEPDPEESDESGDDSNGTDSDAPEGSDQGDAEESESDAGGTEGGEDEGSAGADGSDESSGDRGDSASDESDAGSAGDESGNDDVGESDQSGAESPELADDSDGSDDGSPESDADGSGEDDSRGEDESPAGSEASDDGVEAEGGEASSDAQSDDGAGDDASSNAGPSDDAGSAGEAGEPGSDGSTSGAGDNPEDGNGSGSDGMDGESEGDSSEQSQSEGSSAAPESAESGGGTDDSSGERSSDDSRGPGESGELHGESSDESEHGDGVSDDDDRSRKSSESEADRGGRDDRDSDGSGPEDGSSASDADDLDGQDLGEGSDEGGGCEAGPSDGDSVSDDVERSDERESQGDRDVPGDDGDDSDGPADSGSSAGPGSENGAQADVDPLDYKPEEALDGTDGPDHEVVPPSIYSDTEIELVELGIHDHNDDHGDPTVSEEAAIESAIIQGVYFTAPSANVGGLKVWRYADRHTDAAERIWHAWYEGDTGFYGKQIKADIDPVGEVVLGPALMKLRVAFSDNRRSKRTRGQRSGKIDTRSLGKRAWGNDDRLFGRKINPSKKDYFVVIGLDVSGSTRGVNLRIIKEAALAQAELCERLGVKFAVYAHTGGPLSVDRLDTKYVDIYEIKSPDQMWDKTTRAALSDIGPSAANLDGHTLEFYRKVADSQKATNKVILYYTDGAMPLENYTEELEILQREIALCRQKKITLLGVGIRTDSPIQHGLDTVQVDDSSEVGKVVAHLERALIP